MAFTMASNSHRIKIFIGICCLASCLVIALSSGWIESSFYEHLKYYTGILSPGDYANQGGEKSMQLHNWEILRRIKAFTAFENSNFPAFSHELVERFLLNYSKRVLTGMQAMHPGEDWLLRPASEREFLSANKADFFEQLKKYPQIKVFFLKFPFEALLSILPIRKFYDYSASNCNIAEALGKRPRQYVLRDQHNASCCNASEVFIPVDPRRRLPASLKWGIPPGTPVLPDALLSYVQLVPNGYIVNNGIVATTNVTLQMDGYKMAPMKKSYMNSVIKTDAFRIVEKVFLIHQYWGHGYFHSSLENLPRLAPLLHFLQENEDILIYSVGNYNGILTKLLGIHASRIIKGDIRARIVILPAGVSCGKPSLLHTQLLWQHYHSSLLSVPAHSRDVIVLIRRNHGRRFFKHHDAIHQMLIKESRALNMSVVVFDDRHLPDLVETVKIFNQAFMVVAPHGAGESNLIYSQPGTVLIEALCNDPYPVMCYAAMSQTLGLRYHAHYTKDKPCNQYTAQELAIPVKFYLKHRFLL